MSEIDPIPSVSSTSSTPEVSSMQESASSTAPIVDADQISADSKFASMSNLSQMAPEVAQALAQGIAMNIIRMMKRGAKRMRNIMRTGTPDGSGSRINS